jgi:membrane protease YdiL (CAAX protease family)
MIRAIIYLLAIIAAEVVTIFLQPIAGIAFYTAILIIVLLDAAQIDEYFYGRLVLSLAIVPLVRIVGMSLPLADIPQIWWYPITYVPLLAAAIVLVRLLNYKPKDVGVSFGFFPFQLLIGLVGVGLGIVEYLILAPEPLVTELTWQAAWLPALILLAATGFVEEFIFRGVLQRVATDVFGGWGIVYISLIFATLHIGWIQTENPLTWVDVAFVFCVALFFGWVVKKTGSLFGVTLSHGIINIMMFIVAPFYF